SNKIIGPQDSAEFCVTFKPTSAGFKYSDLYFRWLDRTIGIPLDGSGGCAALAHSPIDVPPTVWKTTADFTFTISNTGSYDWIPGKPVFSPTGFFQLKSIHPDTIAPGGSATVTVEFSPMAIGLYCTTISF